MRAGPAVALLLAVAACEPPSPAARPRASMRPAAPPSSAPPAAAAPTLAAAAAAGGPANSWVPYDSGSVPGAPWRWMTFSSTRQAGDAAVGIVVWDSVRHTTRWRHLEPAGEPAHSLVWRDLDGDRVPDLLTYAGQEDEFETRVWVQRPRAPDGAGAFVAAYESHVGYASLVDLDGDGRPELIDPVGPDVGGDPFTDAEPDDCGETPRAALAAAAAEYARVGRAFDDDRRNGADGAAAFAALQLRSPVRIVHLVNARAVDVTSRFAEHMRWRAGILSGLRAAAGPHCRLRLDSLLAHTRRVFAPR